MIFELLARFFGLGKGPEEKRAEAFPHVALERVGRIRTSLRGKSDYLDQAMESSEFPFWAAIVSLAAADYSLVSRLGAEGQRHRRLLALMVTSFEKINPNVRRNLIFHKMFLNDMKDEGRLAAGMSIPEASGCWILMALTGRRTIDLDDWSVRAAARILGEAIYMEMAGYWEPAS